MLQAGGSGYLTRQLVVIKIDERFGALHQVAGAQAIFHLLCLAQRGVVRHEPLGPAPQALIHQRLARENAPRLLRGDRTVVHEAAGAQGEPQKTAALTRDHLLLRFIPVRLEILALHQVRGCGFDPHRLDLGDASREYARSLDDAGGHDPARAAPGQWRAWEYMKMDNARSQVGAVLPPR